MLLHELQKSPGFQHKGKRRGRGNSSGKGNYSGNGLKGQNARKGGGVPLWFEGGQTPLFMRLPKYRGFKRPEHLRKDYLGLPLNRLERDTRIVSGTEITKNVLLDLGYIATSETSVKLLGTGSLTKALHFSGIEQCTPGAKKNIEQAKGSVK